MSTTEQTIEAEIQAKGKTAPRITPAVIDALMARVAFTGEVAPGTTSTFVHAFLDGSFFLATGHSACVSKENFDPEIGLKLAKSNAEKKARDQLWQLEGYALHKQLANRVEVIARAAHEVNRAYCAALGDNSQPAWEDAPEWQRASAMNGVRFHLANPTAGPDHSHNEWLKEKEAAGWKWGPVKNPGTKEHPCFVPYADLPTEQKAKDFLFRGVVHALA